MPCRDGVRLATRVWSPTGEGPWPVLLMRQPYGRAIASTITYAHPRWYAAHGFLVAVQDVRGRGGSEGRFSGFRQEASDAAAAVSWCRLLEGSDGRVGTYGFSYQGLSQLLNAGRENGSATDGPDPLPDCLAPAMCGTDERLHWASEGGAHWWSLGVGWALQLAAEGCRRRDDLQGWRRIRDSLVDGAYLEEGVELLAELDPTGMGLGWLRLDPTDPGDWLVHPLQTDLLRRPLLLIGGWHDPHLRGVLALFDRSREAGGRPHLCIGAWTHLDWNGGIDHLQLAFFRRHLHPAGDDASGNQRPESGGQSSSLPHDRSDDTLQLQCPRSGRWWSQALDDSQAARGWELASVGLAAIRSDEGELRPIAADGGRQCGSGGLTLVHDPWRPVPSRGGHLGPEPGVVERGDLDRRADVACFQCAPLERSLPLHGRPMLRIRAGADQPGFDLWATLSVVQCDGRVLQLCTGVQRVLGAKALEVQGLELGLQPLATTLQDGERLRLSLAAAAWPAIAVNPGDGSVPSGGSGPSHRIISLDLELEGARLWLNPLIGAN
ncbi:MAG: CocE/NonD family hydrolase [Cyanobium sp.]